MKRTALKRNTPMQRGSSKLKAKRVNAVSRKRKAYRASEEIGRASCRERVCQYV